MTPKSTYLPLKISRCRFGIYSAWKHHIFWRQSWLTLLWSNCDVLDSHAFRACNLMHECGELCLVANCYCVSCVDWNPDADIPFMPWFFFFFFEKLDWFFYKGALYYCSVFFSPHSGLHLNLGINSCVYCTYQYLWKPGFIKCFDACFLPMPGEAFKFYHRYNLYQQLAVKYEGINFCTCK